MVLCLVRTTLQSLRRTTVPNKVADYNLRVSSGKSTDNIWSILVETKAWSKIVKDPLKKQDILMIRSSFHLHPPSRTFTLIPQKQWTDWYLQVHPYVPELPVIQVWFLDQQPPLPGRLKFIPKPAGEWKFNWSSKVVPPLQHLFLCLMNAWYYVTDR